MKIQRMFAAAKKQTTLELLCYDIIGANWDGTGVTAKNVAQKIKDAGTYDSISVRINSPGGDAFEGLAILNLLRSTEKPVQVYVDGLAASAASILAMAGDEITMGEGAMLMIHNAWIFAAGNANELRKVAATLDQVSDSIAQTYVSRTGKTLDDVKTLMEAESWFNSREAVEHGFATGIAKLPENDAKNARALAATYDLSRFHKAPALAADSDETPKPEEPKTEEPATEEPKQAAPNASLELRRRRLQLCRIPV